MYLLRPSERLNRVITEVIARALFLFPVKMHAFAFLSNHWHALVTPSDAQSLSRFVQHIHSNVARAVNASLGREGQVFRSASWIAVARDAEADRLRYVLAQGAKEGLVASPLDWPGVHAARALIGSESFVGARNHAPRSERVNSRAAASLQGRHEIELTPLPCMADLSPTARVGAVADMIQSIVEDAAAQHTRPLGVANVLAQNPLDRPTETKRSRAPLIHTKNPTVRSMFLYARQCFVSAHRAARTDLRSGRCTVLPQRCFPPIVPFQAGTASVLVTAVDAPLPPPPPPVREFVPS